MGVTSGGHASGRGEWDGVCVWEGGGGRGSSENLQLSCSAKLTAT